MAEGRSYARERSLAMVERRSYAWKQPPTGSTAQLCPAAAQALAIVRSSQEIAHAWCSDVTDDAEFSALPAGEIVVRGKHSRDDGDVPALEVTASLVAGERTEVELRAAP